MTTAESKKLNELTEALQEHCESQSKTDQTVAMQLNSLMPLVDLIPMLQELVNDKKTNIAVNERFAYMARVVLTIGGVIGAIFAIVQLIFRLER